MAEAVARALAACSRSPVPWLHAVAVCSCTVVEGEWEAIWGG